MRIAESWLVGDDQPNAPTSEDTLVISGSPPQPALVASTAPVSWLFSVSSGSGSVPATLKGATAMAGPDARIRTVTAVEPLMTKPAKSAFAAPLAMLTLADRLTRRDVAGV